MNRNYSRLAQMIAYKHLADAIIDDILKDGYIDYQMPRNSIQDSKQKDLEGCTALHIVIQHSDIQAAQRLFQNGANFTIQNSIGETPLYQAFVKAYFSKSTKDDSFDPIINAFLDAQVQCEFINDPCDKYGLSHFHIACILNHVAAVEFFLKKKEKECITKTIDAKSPYAPGCGPLHLAAEYGNVETFKILLDHGLDVGLESFDGHSPLDWLIKCNMRTAYWMEICKSVLNHKDKQEFKKNKEMIRSVLKKYQNNKNDLRIFTRLSYLHVVSTLQDISLLEQCLSSNEIDLQDSITSDSHLWPGYTPLHFAAQFSIDTVKLLLKYGANILAKDMKGDTPLDLCLRLYKTEQLRLIVESQPDWKKILLSDSKTSLLDLINAMINDFLFVDFVEKVDINTFIPMNSPLWPGFTPLHLAISIADRFQGIRFMYLDRIKVLVSLGASLTAKDYHGSTPIHLAFRLRKYEVVKLLMMMLKNPPITDHVDECNGISHLQAACAVKSLVRVDDMSKTNDMNVNLPLPSDFLFRWFDTETNSIKRHFFPAGSTPLHMSVIVRDVTTTWVLVKYGADIYAKDSKGMTPIHRLFGSDYSEDLERMGQMLFLRAGLKDVVTSFGLSHLHIACWANHELAVCKLLLSGVSINIKLLEIPSSTEDSDEQLEILSSYEDCRPIHFAMMRKESKLIDILLDYGYYFHGDAEDVLDAAQYSSKFNSFNSFREKHIKMLEIWEEIDGITLLHVACYFFSVDAVEELLKQGVNPNARVTSKKKSWFGLTPLQLLLNRPYYVVSKEQKIKTIAILLMNSGADVNVADSEGATVIHRVIKAFNFTRKELLISLLEGQKDFTVNPGAYNQRISHFHAACACNAVSVVKKFLIYGFNINQAIDPIVAFYGGLLPLHIAALCKFKETVDLLIEYGAEVNAKDSQGCTALHFAVLPSKSNVTTDKENCELIVKSLIRARADVNAINIHGESPLEVYLETQKPSIELLKILSKDQCCVNIFNTKDGIGFIATAIKRLTNIKDIFENPVYQMVINSPRSNKAERNVDSPIHNIVSIKKVAASIKVYTKAIEGFINVGFNIDQENIIGQTALHVAVNFRNSKAVSALLTLGANINLICDGETPFSFHWKYHGSSDMKRLLEKDRQIVKSFVNQIYKLQLVHFQVSEKDKVIEAELRKRQLPLDIKMVEQCQVELERIETRKIGQSDIIWWSFLSETGAIAAFPTMKLIERQIIYDVFEKQSFRLHKEFPEFTGVLYMQYRKALARMSLIKPSKEVLNTLFNFNLPDLCGDRILRFLGNADLVNLIYAKDTPVTHVQKRRKVIDEEF